MVWQLPIRGVEGNKMEKGECELSGEGWGNDSVEGHLSKDPKQMRSHMET